MQTHVGPGSGTADTSMGEITGAFGGENTRGSSMRGCESTRGALREGAVRSAVAAGAPWQRAGKSAPPRHRHRHFHFRCLWKWLGSV